MGDHRYPVEPLLELSGLSAKALSLQAGLNASTVGQAMRRGGFTEQMADRVAVAAGFHPFEVWPEMAEHHLAAASSKSCTECQQLFIPRRSDQRYCSKSCRERYLSREGFRRRYRSDPEFAEKQRQRVAEYQADPRVAEVRRRKERARYRARKEAA